MMSGDGTAHEFFVAFAAGLEKRIEKLAGCLLSSEKLIFVSKFLIKIQV